MLACYTTRNRLAVEVPQNYIVVCVRARMHSVELNSIGYYSTAGRGVDNVCYTTFLRDTSSVTHSLKYIRNNWTRQVKIYTAKLDSGMYRTWHEPMLASMCMQKAQDMRLRFRCDESVSHDISLWQPRIHRLPSTP